MKYARYAKSTLGLDADLHLYWEVLSVSMAASYGKGSNWSFSWH